jgi:hypothetical protein
VTEKPWTAQDRDALIEDLALSVEGGSPLDIQGVWAKRKRAREDADLRCRVRQEQRQEIGRYLRSFKTGEGNDPMAELDRLVEDGGSQKVGSLLWVVNLVAHRLVDVTTTISLCDNSIPSRADFTITVNGLGRRRYEERQEARAALSRALGKDG